MPEIAEGLYNWCLYALQFYRTDVYWQTAIKFLFDMNLCNQPVAHQELNVCHEHVC